MTENNHPAINPITDGVIWKGMLRFFFPLLFGTLFQQLYNTVDAVIVGRFVGKVALSSVGGTSAQKVCCTVSAFVVKAAMTITITTTSTPTPNARRFFFKLLSFIPLLLMKRFLPYDYEQYSSYSE